MVVNNAQKVTGELNYTDAPRITRRQVLTGVAAVPTVAGAYWGYEKIDTSDPVRVAVIGTGDQGNAHISSMNPDYCRVVAFSDIRPSNQKRTRDNLNLKFGPAGKDVALFEDYKELLAKRNDVEMVIIALPLHLHHKATIAALNAGKDVLCEKLMAKEVADCKDMVKTADKAQRLLAVGHQRHYSYLYANCRAIIEKGDVLGQVRHIRALWHRNQTDPAKLGWEKPTGWFKPVHEIDKIVDIQKYGYSSVEELVRWRLFDRTGAGLVAELGSHQLDACSIFLGKKHPKAVLGSGQQSYFKDGREVEDHVFLIYEYGDDADNAVVTYSSIGTNAFDGYGEQVMGTLGTLIVEEEANAFVFREGKPKDMRIKWAEERVSRPVVESGSTTQWAGGAETPDTLTSRGYREEQEHMAWLIRNRDKIVWPTKDNPHPENDPEKARFVPRCHGRVGLDDAVIALVSNLAMKNKQRIEFDPNWFDPYSTAVPEPATKPA